MALLAHLGIIGRPFIPPFMGQILVMLRFISLMTEGAALLEMFVLYNQVFVNQKTFVIFFRLNWRRRTCSPFRFARRYLGNFAKGF